MSEEDGPGESELSDYKIKRKLKPSGVVFGIHIDPDESSEEEFVEVEQIKDSMGNAIIGKLGESFKQ